MLYNNDMGETIGACPKKLGADRRQEMVGEIMARSTNGVGPSCPGDSPGSMYDTGVWSFAATTSLPRLPRIFGMSYLALWRILGRG
jgi:hypothetical protein